MIGGEEGGVRPGAPPAHPAQISIEMKPFRHGKGEQ